MFPEEQHCSSLTLSKTTSFSICNLNFHDRMLLSAYLVISLVYNFGMHNRTKMQFNSQL